MPVANATVKPKAKSVNRRCPRCDSRAVQREIEPGRYCCNRCRAVFEDDDFGYVDDRPDVNAEKREAMSRRRRA